MIGKKDWQQSFRKSIKAAKERRTFMNSKILFFDIDGTILSHRTHQVSDSTKTAISQARENGHILMINTGRPISFINISILDLGFDGYICGCGTYIEFRGKLLMQNTLPRPLSQELIRDLRELKIAASLEGSKAVYYDTSSDNPLIREMIRYQQKHHFTNGSWDDSDIEFDKFCIWPEDAQKENLFYEKYKGTFDFIKRDGHLSEIVPKGYSKASGIQYIINHLGISHEDTYAFGDGENDLPMLTYAKHSIAMGNSPQAIKDIVTHVTGDVDDQGIESALRHLGLI